MYKTIKELGKEILNDRYIRKQKYFLLIYTSLEKPGQTETNFLFLKVMGTISPLLTEAIIQSVATVTRELRAMIPRVRFHPKTRNEP